MKFNILTIFPEMFPGALGQSLAGKALEKGLWNYNIVNIRDFADGTKLHKSVDDSPYGGGAGMVMRADILGKAIDFANGLPRRAESAPRNDVIASEHLCSAKQSSPKNAKIIYPSPRGKPFNQRKVEELCGLDDITILCGRYEGIDQRVIDKYDIEEVSIGDFILSGGEIAAFVIIDACIRKLDGVIGNSQTHLQESFASGEYEYLLEYPLYTRPEEFGELKVPEVLVSGNHKKIEEWRLEKAEEITKLRRPDLWSQYLKSKKDN